MHSNSQAQKPGIWYFAALPRLLVKAVIYMRLILTTSHHPSPYLNMSDTIPVTSALSARQAALNKSVQQNWYYWRYLYIPGAFLFMLGSLSLAYAVHLDRARAYKLPKPRRISSFLFYVLGHQLLVYGILICISWYMLKNERPGPGFVHADADKNALGSIKQNDRALGNGPEYFVERHAVPSNNVRAIPLVRSAITVAASALAVVALVTRYNCLDSECPFQQKCYVVSIACITIAFSRYFWGFLEYVRKIRTYMRNNVDWAGG